MTHCVASESENEEEYKWNLSTDVHIELESHNAYQNKITVEFVQPQHSDSIDCQANNHMVNDCNSIKRLLYLLAYHHQHPNDNLYEHLLSLKNYNFPTLLEDWHQVKNNHLRNKDIDWIKNNIGMQCDSTECQYIH
eukprot:59576_1